jgi:hypothetical protein
MTTAGDISTILTGETADSTAFEVAISICNIVKSLEGKIASLEQQVTELKKAAERGLVR